jgi:ribonuclease E
MASPDDARVDEARDQPHVPTSPPATTDTADRASVPATGEPPAPQRRPRGAASFPGGPPPAAPAPADTPAAPLPPPEPAPPPQFRVTTVESAGASFAGGPPPPSPAPREDSPPVPEPEAPAVTAASVEAPAPPAAPEAAPAPETGPAGEATATRTGGRRRRRGGRGRGPADAAGASADPAAPGETTTGTAGPDPVPAVAARSGLGGAAPRDLAPDAAADGPVAAGDASAPAAEATGPAGPETGQGQATPTTAGGSARTRARRRRRAAAKARGRDAAGDTAQPDQTGDTPGDEPAESAVPSRTARPRGGGSGEATTQAQATPTGAADTQAAAPAPSRTRSRRRGGGNGDPQPARPNGDPQPANGDAQPGTGTGTRTSGGRGRRRGRGGGRLAAVDADATAATTDAPAEGETREQQGGGRGRSGSSERSTRLETRSRREGARQTDRGRRRRPSGLTEEQKRILREEGPDRRMVVTEGAERTQIGVLEGPTLVEHYVTRKAGRSMVGNIYLGRVQNVLPGMEAAFVDIGRGRNAVLYAGEVNYNEEDLDGEAPRIEKVLKAGQPVLVQVTKDPIGAKGARLTAQVSLAGRYLVLQPEDNTFGISRRLPETERSRLRDILKEVRPKGLGLIVRTAAEGASADDLRADLARLQARWEAVERKAKKSSAPAVIYSEPELVVRVIRDIFSPDFVELVVDGDDLHQRVEEYLTEVAPDLLPKLHRHQGGLPVFEHYRVVEQIHKALERKVWLPSGGSIVIDRTEAMTVIDVNTGKFVGKANLEETVVANNLEAADEIVRQLRLRDIGGIIIIDFIDMLFERNQQAVVDRLRAALVRDKTKSQVMEVSSLGLVQMTRKRVSGGLLDSFSETCPTCDGRGVVITHEI